MLTTEDYDSQTDKLNKLAEEVGTKITMARRASGLNQWEFSQKLGIPVCFMDILENGILVADENHRYVRWAGCIFSERELTRISNRLEKEFGSLPGASAADSETVFFCPITLNSNSAIDEIQIVANHNDLSAYMVQHIANLIGIKYRISYAQTRLAKGRETADAMKQRVLSVLSACGIRS